MWENMVEDINELNCDFGDIIDSSLLYGIKESYFRSLKEILNKYYTVLDLLDIQKMGILLKDFGDSLCNVDINNINKDSAIEIIEFLYDDIINFFNNIFISCNTKNINYLTDSMRSSLYQIQIELKIKNNHNKKEEYIDLF
jgi:hypothetical protein